MQLLRIIRPNVANFGFALFLAVDAAAWSGAFPLLPTSFQSFDVILIYSILRSVSLCLTFAIAVALSYWRPSLMRHPTSVLGGPLMFFGSICLICPLYLPTATIALIVVGGMLLGAGSALFYLSWQRLFASQDATNGILDLVLGVGYSAPTYLLLHAIPPAVAAFTIPLVFVPLAEACLIDASHGTDFRQPMFADTPSEHAAAYIHSMRASWKSAMCVASFAFAAGIARGLAVNDPAVGALVNYASMAGSLVSAVALVSLWRRFALRFDTLLVFRTIFPIVITVLLTLPFLGDSSLRLFAGIMYSFFSFATIIMMIQCAQISRDSGISPTFIYGFYAGIVYLAQNLGFLLGFASFLVEIPGFSRSTLVALVCVWLMALALYLVRGKIDASLGQSGLVEFIVPLSARTTLKRDGLENPAEEGDVEAEGFRAGDSNPKDSSTSAHAAVTTYAETRTDYVLSRCDALTKRYLLSSREGEVLELLAYGNSIPRIAKMLFISENTAKTHCKRIYAKLNVHKREELLDMIFEDK